MSIGVAWADACAADADTPVAGVELSDPISAAFSSDEDSEGSG